ncbi:hypothetical protein SH580_17215 [Coraliomargarita algicola]|uniref:PEP-CTERM protein-sorting domain-containing protein n=1 Tax=Coraliomargarita algicola TaxID=3092156 RepID=A0ABZ0RQG2_9BACT|nr:hypothetical protein [Coraliomargarita sp. J2-16]WPJ95164.1 hypothetical protein SH580_17215 [Coraliomargarita sp. J2-16]
MNKNISITLAALIITTYAANAQVVVSSISDLVFTPTGSSSIISNTDGTLTIDSSKNTQVSAALPTTYSLDLNDTISVTFDVQINDLIADTSSEFVVRFGDATDYFEVRVDPVTTMNGITFGELNDTNIGRTDADTSMGTSLHSFVYTLERTATEEITNTLTSPSIVASSISANSDVVPLQISSFNQISFRFSGNGWNETFGVDDHKPIVDISNFSIATTAVIPETNTFALLTASLVFSWVMVRRRK